MPETKPPQPVTDPLISTKAAARMPMTQEMAADAGKKSMAEMSAKLGIKVEEACCVIQWGKKAFRPGEPALLTGQFMNSNPHVKGVVGFYAAVMYLDTGPYYVDMSLPQYPHGKKPPWLMDRNVYEDQKNGNGLTEQVVARIERTEDRKHWLEFIPLDKCRKAYKVKE